MASYSTHENNRSQIFNRGKNLIFSTSKKVGNFVKTTADSAATTWRETSTVKKVCIIGSASTAAVLAPLAIIPALGAVGFTSAGVAAGSIAASLQTATTISGSLFALCQSAGAVGAVAASTSIGVGLTAGAATAGVVTAAVCRNEGRSQDNDGEGQAEPEEQIVQTEAEEQIGQAVFDEQRGQAEVEEQIELAASEE
jgi:hypothetical protein